MIAFEAMSQFMHYAKNKGKLPRGLNMRHLSEVPIFIEWILATEEGAAFCRNALEEIEREKRADLAARLAASGFGEDSGKEETGYNDAWMNYSKTGKSR